jgi:predicted DNA-binding transcriptional regulator AlpA
MELMTLEEAALFLKKSPAQMRWMRHMGTGPKSAKVGGRVMFRKSDVMKWVDAQFEAEAG